MRYCNKKNYALTDNLLLNILRFMRCNDIHSKTQRNRIALNKELDQLDCIRPFTSTFYNN